MIWGCVFLIIHLIETKYLRFELQNRTGKKIMPWVFYYHNLVTKGYSECPKSIFWKCKSQYWCTNVYQVYFIHEFYLGIKLHISNDSQNLDEWEKRVQNSSFKTKFHLVLKDQLCVLHFYRRMVYWMAFKAFFSLLNKHHSPLFTNFWISWTKQEVMPIEGSHLLPPIKIFILIV